MRILALTEDPVTRDLLARVLEGRQPMLALSPAAAVAALSEATPDLVFIDVSAFAGAALALVHHVKALAPDARIHAMARPDGLEAAAAAVALGGASVLVLPLEGDEVLSAVTEVEDRAVQREDRERFGQATTTAETLLTVARELSATVDAPDRAAAASSIAKLVQRVLGSRDVAIYLSEGADLFMRGEDAAIGSETPRSASLAELEGLSVSGGWHRLPLALGGVTQAHVLLRPAPASTARHAVEALTALAAVPLAMASSTELGRGSAIKDPGSSAYSFAYYVDVAGREIDRARRHNRRFSIATITLGEDQAGPDIASAVDRLLEALGDTAILARVDDLEFHALLPETDGLGGHACRRRVLAKLGPPSPHAAAVGVATYPHDGQDLSRLLRIARRRREACRDSSVQQRIGKLQSLDEMLWALEGDPAPSEGTQLSLPTCALDLPPDAITALVSSILADAGRGGSALVLAAGSELAHLGGAVRRASATAREGVAVYVVDLDRMPGQPTVEALAVLSEHATYALLAREAGGRLRGVHSADPLLADLLAERVGRTAGVRLT